jgi:hypothetical protein
MQEFDMLIQLGFTKFKVVEQKGISRQKEPNPSKEGVFVGFKFNEGCSGLFGEDLSGKWKNYKEILIAYKGIFLLYKLFGDYGIVKKNYLGSKFRKVISKALNRPVPGWHDTHAKFTG